MRLKVNNGTVSSNADLCGSCIYAFRVRSVDNATYTICKGIQKRVSNKIAECTMYSPAKQPHGEFYKLAWGYNLNVNTGMEGFYHPQDISWSKKLPPPIKPAPIIMQPIRKSWKQRLRSKMHSILDIALRPITK